MKEYLEIRGGIAELEYPRNGAIDGSLSKSARHEVQSQYTSATGYEIRCLIEGKPATPNRTLAGQRIADRVVGHQRDLIRVAEAKAVLSRELFYEEVLS